MREINLLDQEINCYDDIQYIEENDSLSFAWETWFEVDKYFGTNTREYDDRWVNFYTNWFENGDVRGCYEVDTDLGTTFHNWELTDEEKKFLTKKMEEYVISFGQEDSLLECLNNERAYHEQYLKRRRI